MYVPLLASTHTFRVKSVLEADRPFMLKLPDGAKTPSPVEEVAKKRFAPVVDEAKLLKFES